MFGLTNEDKRVRILIGLANGDKGVRCWLGSHFHVCVHKIDQGEEKT